MADSRLFLRKVNTGKDYPLTGVVLVGREVPDGIKLIDEGVSRRHATLSVVDGIAYVEDAGSRNGTTVNAKLITAKTALKAGDRVKFDTEEFEFRVDSGDATVMHTPKPQKQSPRSWADVQFDEKGTDGTERFDPAQLQEYLRKAKERQQRQELLDVQEPCLRVSSDGQPERTIPLNLNDSPTQEWTIGRSSDSSIALDQADVSDRHAKLVRTGNQWKLLDAFSTNGSYVNDLRVGMAFLSSGDTISFGPRVQCVFNLPKRRSGSTPVANRPGNFKKILVIGIGVSFLLTLVILFWLFRGRFT